jgi:hypothetical protein
MSGNEPMLKAAGLWAKTSSGGKRYLTGRLGGVKVLILENRDRRSDDDPTHNLFFVEAPDKRQAGLERDTAPARQQASGSAPPTAGGLEDRKPR